MSSLGVDIVSRFLLSLAVKSFEHVKPCQSKLLCACLLSYFCRTCILVAQEQVAEFEQERLELRNEISKLKEQNERLNSELSLRSQTVDKLKNKVQYNTIQ